MTDFTEFIKVFFIFIIMGIIWVGGGIRNQEKYLEKRRELEKQYDISSDEFKKALSWEKNILYRKIFLLGILAMAVFTLLHRIFNLP